MNKNDFYWYWLANIAGVGRGTIRRLLEKFEMPEAIYRADEKEVFSFLRNENQKSAFSISKNKESIINSYKILCEQEIMFVHPGCKRYPRRLRNISDAPFGLYLKGAFPAEDSKAVAIIGARNCTRYGMEMAQFFGSELAECGVSVISGLARGVDGMAHTGALEAGGYTLGVIGGGIDQVYPKENYKLFIQMKACGGILSENNIGIAPAAGLFPQRNRLIAGLSDGILVVEAMEKSGTFITVDQGLEQGKEIFALPGRVLDAKSAGCNNLIKLGAHMVTEVEDILEILHIKSRKASKPEKVNRMKKRVNEMSLAPIEKMVYSCLRIDPKYLDDIICETQIAPQEVCMALNSLVIYGVIVETAKNYYAIKI